MNVKEREQRSGQETGRSGDGLLRQLLQRLAHGDIGSLPVLLGLVLIAVVFQIANPNFLTPLNLTNLMVQISSVGTIAVGVVLVLLIGEIDLSVGAVSGLCAGIMGVLSVKIGLPGVPTVLLSLLAGFLIGLFQGWWITRLHVPSFVVTLAGYLGWQGALLWVLGSTGTINLNDLFIVGLANTRLPVWMGWTIGAAAVAIFLLASAGLQIRKSRQSLHSQSVLAVILRGVVIAIVVLGPVAIMSVNRNPRGNVPVMGVPTAVVILLAIIIAFNFLTKRTRYGRYVFAVGGGAEAARRAGINVNRIRIWVFALCSTLAAAGGVLAGSRLFAVNQSSGGGDVLLNSIAAAVIGGTSLFGGRGSTWSALLGALIIGAIANGMDLLAFASSVRFMITGAVLLVAVTIDAYSRARREQAGQ
jgi:D-xylose transport system permease protein